jgi:hypothetical protein
MWIISSRGTDVLLSRDLYVMLFGCVCACVCVCVGVKDISMKRERETDRVQDEAFTWRTETLWNLEVPSIYSKTRRLNSVTERITSEDINTLSPSMFFSTSAK